MHQIPSQMIPSIATDPIDIQSFIARKLGNLDFLFDLRTVTRCRARGNWGVNPHLVNPKNSFFSKFWTADISSLVCRSQYCLVMLFRALSIHDQANWTQFSHVVCVTSNQILKILSNAQLTSSSVFSFFCWPLSARYCEYCHRNWPAHPLRAALVRLSIVEYVPVSRRIQNFNYFLLFIYSA